ncbi:hypothetical protein [Azospira restricta]|uniref:Citryl-CoA lyase n=1 Tax=Azospira restricta TaxID=404405 RepID=A0A974SQP9_9RHOO|nr:hypothetical protein [Azospira restricta]QRJ64763.1 citryl-CoA lyase [Azospira restricta]
MNGPQSLQAAVGRLKTRMGAFFPGSHVIFRGHDLHAELKDMDWIELYVFGITGRRFTAEQLRLMHALWTTTSYPDARIWNNRIAALAGSARSTGNLGLAAALAVSEAHIYGRGNEVQAISFFLATRRALDAGGELADCLRREMATYGRIAGYGRPLVNADERIAPIMALAGTLGLADGPHLALAFAVEQHLLASGRNLRMNYGAVVSAFGADLGMSPREFYLFMFPSFLAGMPPCFIEAAGKMEGGLFPLPCSGIDYAGVPRRSWVR